MGTWPFLRNNKETWGPNAECTRGKRSQRESRKPDHSRRVPVRALGFYCGYNGTLDRVIVSYIGYWSTDFLILWTKYLVHKLRISLLQSLKATHGDKFYRALNRCLVLLTTKWGLNKLRHSLSHLPPSLDTKEEMPHALHGRWTWWIVFIKLFILWIIFSQDSIT